MNLNFTISELVKSNKAKEHNIKNTPDLVELDNMLNLIVYCLQPIRELVGKPVIITSGFRTPQLNKIVCGKANSQHLEGKAADFIVKGESVAVLALKIKDSNIEYDQLINEYGKWVHISFNKGHNRRQYIKFG